MGNRKGMGGHHSARMKNNEWLTPPEILGKLGAFDLDPCAPVHRPWPTARVHLTQEDDGLARPWTGRVWLNPPYGLEAARWLEKLADHGNGIALIFARTETEMFFSTVWDRADAVLFIHGRLHFYNTAGERAAANAGAPSVLVAYGWNNVVALEHCDIEGKLIVLGDEFGPAISKYDRKICSGDSLNGACRL